MEWVLGLDCGLGEGNFEMVIPSHVVVVESHQSLDGFLHGRHLDQGHLPVPGEEAGAERVSNQSHICGAVQKVQDEARLTGRT